MKNNVARGTEAAGCKQHTGGAYRAAAQRGAWAARHLEPQGHRALPEGFSTPELEAEDRPWTWWGRPDTPVFWPVVVAATSRSCPQGVFRTQVNTLRGYSRAPSPLNPLLASPSWEVDIVTLI